VRGDLAVSNVEPRKGRQLRFYAYANRTWSEVNRITMQELCSNGVANDIHLGDDLMVVEAGDVWCVWERLAGRWTFSRTIGHKGSANVRVSKNRILIQSSRSMSGAIVRSAYSSRFEDACGLATTRSCVKRCFASRVKHSSCSCMR
jgi:hypothetical protein